MILKLIFVFMIGATFGWILEMIYRSILERKILNPGFLTGPFLPIYGLGTVLLYFVSYLEIDFFLRILLFIFVTTGLEFFGGLFFLYYYKIKLWDYSKNKFNVLGIICPFYSLIWLVLSLFFYYLIFPHLKFFVNNFMGNIWLIFLVGMFYGIFIIDLVNALDLAQKIKQFLVANKNKIHSFKINFEQLKKQIRGNFGKVKKQNFLKNYFFPLNSLFNEDLFLQVEEFVKKHKMSLKEKVFEKIRSFHKK